MTYAYLLAGENLELALAELQGFLESQEVAEEASKEGRLAFTGAEPGQLKRLALVHEVSEILERGSLEELDLDYRPGGSYAVRAVDVNNRGYDTSGFEEDAGEALSTGENVVDLENPDEDLRLYLLEDEYVLARLVEDIDRGLFGKRSNEERPFSSPVSLDPALARVMVNLAGVRAGERLLDPFCGTGGILIEAGLCGIGVHGLDIQEEMVGGTEENLEAHGIIEHDIRRGSVVDAAEIFERAFDAVVTDLPYGKASKTDGNPVEAFLEVAPELADNIVFMSNHPGIDDLEPEYSVYVHKNLTRYIYII